MTLWINGDWVTGEGDARTKTNPVGQEVLWSGNDASAGQVEQACRCTPRVSGMGETAILRAPGAG